MKKLGVEDKILLVVCVLMLIWFVYILTGCSVMEQSAAKFRYSDGCYMELEMVGQDSAKEILKDFDFKPCEAKVETDLTEKE